ncbi:autotransporter outer membrane beta-barrel domain-containing protein [Fusobacterium sp.]|uniref:autotransporter family protein n=1 Tax=Fusobacterium sp. TaxID=68766 RepID=UPI0029016954|nr:autotransporter outer membrane beta-barrel domain-containing protein [Fusobacterium sp.]MDU1911416.1 autotransporter outer membrane beta-barrel domain-containing protein [Fusobacterium sp.]
MIEKVMKRVKRGNKKRGINITIGAIIGLILSCTAVMGADIEIGHKIDNMNDSEYDFINNGDISVSNSSGNALGVFVNSSTMRNILNNKSINAIGNLGCGIFITSSKVEENIINNGTISAVGTNGSNGININGNSTVGDIVNNGNINVIGISNGNVNGYGIYLDNSTVEEIINSGSINVIGISNGNANGYGIYLDNSIVGEINNSGIIIGYGNSSYSGGYGYGISLIGNSSIKGNITNSGSIVGFGFGSSDGYGIYLTGNSSIQKYIINSGNIVGFGSGFNSSDGYGISLRSGLATKGGINNNESIIAMGSSKGYGIYNKSAIENLTNTGVIFGTTNAVKNDRGGSIISTNNYGILATEGSSIVTGTTVKNSGLLISGATGVVTAGIEGIKRVVVGHDEEDNELIRTMTIKNAVIQGGSGITTDSFIFSGNSIEFDNSILNGKDKTLKVSDSGEIKGSIINAYGTAVLFDGADNQLTLSGTIVNGGIDGTNTIIGSDNGDTLILQSGDITYLNGTTDTQNTIINGNIDMKDGDDILTIRKGTIINGTLDGGLGNDTLNFEAALKTSSNSEIENRINILHNISGFENMNINTNVTLFETTFDSSGNSTDLKVTGAKNITIGANGVLTLRIDTNKVDSSSGKDKIIGHVLYGNNGVISSTGGKLLLALNGARNKSIISFGDTKLGNSLVTGNEAKYQEDVTFDTTSLLHSVKRVEGENEIEVTAKVNLPAKPINPDNITYEKLNKIYHSIISVDELENFDVDDDEKLSLFLGYLNDIYAGNPYSYSSELSRKSMGMFKDIVTENQFKADTGKWMIYGGLTHIDGGTKDTYYGKGYYSYDIGSSDIDADTKITGAYILGEYGISDTLTSGVIVGGNKLKSDLSNGSKVDGDALYLGAYAKKYVGNLKVTAGLGLQYGDYDVDRLGVNRVASDETKAVMKYSDNYNDISYDIYLNGRYSNPIGDNLFLEPYGTLSYTYIDQDGADEGNKALAIETDSKSFDYTSAKVGVDLKKVIPHEKGKSTLSAGVSYTRILSGAGEEHITGRFKGGTDFDILVAHKNEHNIGVNAKYDLELENGILFDVKGSYAVERDSNNNSGKNKTKGEWIVGIGLGYEF